MNLLNAMKRKTRPTVNDPHIFDILSAAWIFACNDENEIITYKGVKHRLSLPENYDLETLIKSRGELFRRGVPNHRLKKWKTEMLSGKRIPVWINEIEDKDTRKQEIEAITSDNVFRSQFRAEQGALKSDVDLIDWGLQHIDRLRKANLDASHQIAIDDQITLVFYIGIANIVVTVLIALFGYFKT